MATIFLRKARPEDVDAIMAIVNDAKELLKKDGSPQWQDGHPNRENFLQDISREISWVLVVGNEIAGTAALQLTPDSAYSEITDGMWFNTANPYATIHRVCISNHFRGQHLAKFLFSNLITIGLSLGYSNFRLDTHAKNLRMQKLAQDWGFVRRGIISVDDKIDPKRIAFELNISNKD